MGVRVRRRHRDRDEDTLPVFEAARRNLLPPDLVRRLASDGLITVVKTLEGEWRVSDRELRELLTREDERVRRELADRIRRDERLERLEALATWLAALDHPERRQEKMLVTLRLIIDRARGALDDGEGES